MSGHDLLGYCGLFCGGCGNHHGNGGEFSGRGCRAENELVADCPTKACAAGKGVLDCGECDGFPCDELGRFYSDGIRHHAAACANIGRIRLIGPEQWLSEQEKEHTCDCGKRRLWFSEKCTHDSP
ncbi:MAG: DUF3795 domain-containing protein [Candidatus Edwardsbacteria bacterium]|nr:DUF3795 domain-containing protein [Candidatus Edwardsbacteria bacterium]